MFSLPVFKWKSVFIGLTLASCANIDHRFYIPHLIILIIQIMSRYIVFGAYFWIFLDVLLHLKDDPRGF